MSRARCFEVLKSQNRFENQIKVINDKVRAVDKQAETARANNMRQDESERWAEWPEMPVKKEYTKRRKYAKFIVRIDLNKL